MVRIKLETTIIKRGRMTEKQADEFTDGCTEALDKEFEKKSHKI